MRLLEYSFVRNTGKWAHKQFELQIIRQHGNYHLCPKCPNIYTSFGAPICMQGCYHLSHTPHCLEGVRITSVNLPWAIQVWLWIFVTHSCIEYIYIYIYLDICVGELDQHWYSRQAITWTNVRLLPIGPLETNFSEIPIKLQNFYLKKMHSNKASAKWRPFCQRGDELTHWGRDKMAAIYQTTFSNAFP